MRCFLKFIIPLTLALWVVECAIPQNEHPSEGLHALLKKSDEKDAEETTTILGDLENINGELNAELRKLLAESYRTGEQRKLLSQRKIVLAGLKDTELGLLPNGENYKTSVTVLPDGRTVRYNGSNRKINAVATDGAFSLNAEPDSFKMFYYEVEITKCSITEDGMGARYYDNFFLEFAYRYPSRYEKNPFSEYYSLAEFNYDGSKEHYKVQSFKDGKFGKTFVEGENASVIGVGLVVPPADELVKKSGAIRPRALVTVHGQLIGKLLPVDYTDWPAWLHNDEIRADDDRITSLLTKISPKILVRSFGTDLKVNFGEDPKSLAIWTN